MINLFALAVSVALAGAPPETPKKVVTDTYHGVEVVDDYRWLEDWNDPAVKEWSEAQNAHARGVLDALPSVAQIRERVAEVLGAELPSYSMVQFKNRVLFAMKRQPPKQQPFLVVLPTSMFSAADEVVVVDPNAIDPRGHTSIDWFVPSHDGTKVAVSMSGGGSESGDLHFFDVATGKPIDTVIARVNGGTAGGSVAWDKESKGVFYTRYPREGERPAEDLDFFMQVYYHELGTPESSDRYEVGKQFPRIAEIQLQTHVGAGNVLATVQNGDGGEFAFYLKTRSGDWIRLIDYKDKVVQAAFGTNDKELFLISRQGSPRGRILKMDWTLPRVDVAEEIVKQGPDTIVSDFWDPNVFAVTPQFIIATYQTGGPSEVRVFNHAGAPLPGPAHLPVSSVNGIIPVTQNRFLFQNVSYLEPAAWYLFDGRPGRGAATEKTALTAAAPVDFSDCDVVREFATSKDGTKVPVNIIKKKGIALDGSHPCVLYGYGGYGVNVTPGFSAADRILVEQGVILAEANIRGGGEYGEEWHLQGNLLNKQNVFDDFAAAARHLVERKYTTSSRLAIQGGSNGGLLMGALFTQHPDLVKCVVSHVGIYDMLRVELSSNGAFNIPEFGTVKDKAQFTALHAYSPYHRVVNGTKYPPILFLTGANDPRVDPMQSRKMTARMQEAGASVLLRTSASSGHGQGTALNERIEQTVDVMAFLFDQLGVEYKPVAKKAADKDEKQEAPAGKSGG